MFSKDTDLSLFGEKFSGILSAVHCDDYTVAFRGKYAFWDSLLHSGEKCIVG